MKKTILLLAAFMLTFVCSAKKSVHQHLTFDNGWSFRLCTDSADVISTLRKLGVNDSPYTTTKVEARKTKVTDDTEPEQAQVTAAKLPDPALKRLLAVVTFAAYRYLTTGVRNCLLILR
jgi:hypothetical protein